MHKLAIVALSATSAAVVALVASSLLNPEIRVIGSQGNPIDLATRLARLERALDDLPSVRPESARSLSGSTEIDRIERAPVEQSPADGIARLSQRLDEIERKLDALDDDPLTRAHSYLSSTSPRARREAIELLRRFAPFDPEARDAIRAMLTDEDDGVRREAIEAIARTRDRQALPQVQAMLGDENARVRGEAADALEDLLTGVPKNSPEFRAGIEALTARALDSDARVREEIVDTLGDLGPELAGPTLMRLLDDGESDVREEAIEALGRSGHTAAVPRLRQLYETTEADRRLDVAIALSRLGDPAAFQQEAVALVANARNMSISERERARDVAVLGRVDPDTYRSVLTAALDDPSGRVRREAERALRRSR